MLDIFTKTTNQPSHGILIVGEGNFSFARDIVTYETKTPIHATSFDSTEVVHKNHFAKDNVQAIEACGNATVQHSIDATRLSTYYQQQFNVIIFNFPHTGGKSNTKKCRKLLVDFFASADAVLCEGGRILVSLCRGQGGTPSDKSRVSYGNSWKVATCASVSGFILRDLFPFDSKSLQFYRTAGYRGEIGQNFFTVQGLVHVFEKGISLRSLQPGPSDVDYDDVEKLGELLSKHNDLENLNSLYFRDEGNVLFEQLESFLCSSLGEKLNELNISCPKIDHNASPLPVNLKKINNALFCTEFDGANSMLYDDFQYSFYSINKNADISPFSHPLTHHVNFDINTSKNGVALTDIKLNLLSHLTNTIFQKFETVILDCDCSVSKCCWPHLRKFESQITYDVDAVPNFIEKVPPAFWTSFPPEIVVTGLNENNEVEYRKEECQKYQLDRLEKKYFGISETDDHKDKTCTKVIADGRCVAVVVSRNDDQGNEILALTFNSNEIFLLAYVQDLRYLWSEDNIAKEMILAQLQEDTSNNVFSTHTLTKSLVKHPLCYRHDLCFWLSDDQTEEDLLNCMRLICGDTLHSVRLIKVLRHVETQCTSYCYRMIYSRIDGPLSHEESVKLQNRLRLLLLHKGYKLR